MSVIPPLLPPPGPDGGGEFRPAPWGIGVTAYGILTTFFVLLALGGLFMLGTKAAGIGEDSNLYRCLMLLVSDFAFLVVPFGAARMTPLGLGALGFTRPMHGAARAVAEGAGIGALLLALTQGYEKLLKVVAPAAAKAFEEETNRQAGLLELPWPLLVVLVVLIAPVCEEVLFRGFIFGGLRGALGFPLASALAAVLFAFAHWFGWAIIALFVIGLGCAAAYERHRSLWASIAVHAAYNGLTVVMAYLFPGM